MRYLKLMIDLALVLCMALLVPVAVPSMLGFSVYAVVSSSMEPAIPVGSAVYVLPKAFEKIRVGDVVTFRIAGGTASATHRVVEKDDAGQMLLTKGDANGQPDKRVGYADVIGVVRCSLPYLGYLAAVFGRTEGKLLLAGAFLWLLLLDGIVSGRTSIRIRERRSYYEH